MFEIIEKSPSHSVAMMEFSKTVHDGLTLSGTFDILDGKFDYRGDLPVTDAARLLFESLVQHIDEMWLDRARTKNVLQ